MPRRLYYAVKTGRQTGVFSTWEECEKQVKNYPDADFKKFANQTDAETYLDGGPSSLGLSIALPTTSDVPSTHTGNKRGLSPGAENRDIVYSDGACKGNGRHGSVAGIGVWWGHNDPRNLSERCPGDQTNNRAELLAIGRVLETASTGTVPLIIKTDSQYSCNCFGSWLATWEKNDYRTAGGHPVKNIGLILYIKALLDARRQAGQEVKLEHVRGHSGIAGNEAADALANHGATLPPEPERDWKALEMDVRRKMAGTNVDSTPSPANNGILTRSQNSPNKVRKVSLDESQPFPSASPSSSRSETIRPIQLPFASSSTAGPRRNFRSNAKTELSIVVDPKDIDWNLYVDCLLEEDELWKDLD